MPAGRPLKNGVSYFPLDVIMCDKFELIESEHGIQGFGVVIKLYQKIYADNYYIMWDKKALLVFSNRINVDINSINAVINSCVEWGIFNEKLYKKYTILTSTGIQKRFFEIVKRRKVVELCNDYLLTEIDINAYNNLIYVDSNSQRKGKGKEIKGNKDTDLLLQYLKTKIESEKLTQHQDKIIEFYNYRMNKPKDKKYKSEKGINGLFRDIKNCSNKSFNITECLDIAMEREWQTPDVSYFKDNDFIKTSGQVKNQTDDEIFS